MTAQRKFRIVLRENGRLSVEGSAEEFLRRFGISGGEIDLTVALLAIYEGVAELTNERQEPLTLSDLLALAHEDKVSAFFAALDLLRRGKRVRIGLKYNELMLDDNVMVVAVDEDSAIRASDLYNLVDRYSRQGYRTLMALVDSYGDVAYYEVSKTFFPKLRRR